MKIHILGSGAYPIRFLEGKSTCIFFPEHDLIIDGGFGIVALPDTFKSKHLHILLTHFHHDHILGLASIGALIEEGRVEKITIYGDERIEKLGMFFQEPFNPTYIAERMPITMQYLPETSNLAGLEIMRKQVPHASGFSNMYRLGNGSKQIGMITDTTPNPDFAPLFNNVDLLLHECNYDNAHKNQSIFEGHAYADAVISFTQKCNAKKLILIHTDPRYPLSFEEVKQKIPSAEKAFDGMDLDI